MTPHFGKEEFAQRGWEGGPAIAYPEAWLQSRLKPLCEALEVVRAIWGQPIEVVSGYRSPAFNASLPGAARKSQHMLGRAADIKVHGVDPDYVHDGVLRLVREGKLPRVKGLGRYPTFTHIDIRIADRLARWTGSIKGS